MTDDSAESLFQCLLHEALVIELLFWDGQRCPLFDAVYLTFPLPTTASPTFQGALEDSFGEAVVAM